MSAMYHASHLFLLLFLFLNFCSIPCFAQNTNDDDMRRGGTYFGFSFATIDSPIMFEPDESTRKEFALPEKSTTFTLSGGYEFPLPNPRFSAFIGIDFSSASFSTFTRPSMPDLPELSSPVTYLSPTYTLITLDLDLHYLPKLTFPCDLYAVGMLGMSVESYTISNPGTFSNPYYFGSYLQGDQTRAHGQFGIGLGIRLFLFQGLSINLEHQWLYGEGKEKLEYDHEDETYIYYRRAGFDLKGPTKLFTAGIGYHIR